MELRFKSGFVVYARAGVKMFVQYAGHLSSVSIIWDAHVRKYFKMDLIFSTFNGIRTWHVDV